VSEGLQYWNVTPALLAFWLGDQVISTAGPQLMPAVRQLSDELWTAFVGQLVALGASEEQARRIREVLDNEESFRGAVEHLSTRDADFLSAAVFAAPSVAGSTVVQCVLRSSRVALRDARSVRKPILWAVEALLWEPSVAGDAMRALCALAVAENEEYANNATGQLEVLFQVRLGGTCLEYQERLGIAQELLSEADEEAAIVLVKGLAGALKGHESRVELPNTALRRRFERRPQTYGELRASQVGAVSLLLGVLDRFERLETQVADVIGNGLYTLAASGAANEVVGMCLSRAEWSIPARRELWIGARRARWFVEIDEEKAKVPTGSSPAHAQLAALEQAMLPIELPARAEVIFGASWWAMVRPTQLDDDADVGLALANEIAALPIGEAAEILSLAEAGDDETVWRVCTRIGERLASRELMRLIVERTGHVGPAARGVIAGADRAGANWIDEELEGWEADPRLRDTIIPSLHNLRASDRRARIALAAVEAGAAAGQLRVLLLGAWVKGLSEEPVLAIVHRLLEEGSEESIIGAVGMLDQWIGSSEGKPSAATVSTVRAAIEASSLAPERQGVMANYRARLREYADFSARDEAQLSVQALLRREQGAGEEDIMALRRALREAPDEVCEVVLEAIKSDAAGRPPWALTAEGGKYHVLSVIEEEIGAERLWGKIRHGSVEEIRQWMRHYDMVDGIGMLARRVISDMKAPAIADQLRHMFVYPRVGIAGSLAAFYRGRLALLRSQLSGERNPAVRAWGRRVERVLEGETHRGARLDEEHES